MIWPSIVLAGLGAYHGLNSAMGWLFAVALGLHWRSAAVVTVALVPIALGYALSLAIAAGIVVTLGVVVDPPGLRLAAGAALCSGRSITFSMVRGTPFASAFRPAFPGSSSGPSSCRACMARD